MSINPAEIQLSPEQQAYVAAEAERTGRSWSEVLDQRLPTPAATSCAAGENALEAAQRLGLVGSCNSGHDDLATNPVHMEGFGQDALGASTD